MYKVKIMKAMKKIMVTMLILVGVMYTLTACSKEKPTFTKDASSDTNITFTFMITDTDGSSIADTSIKVVGDDANLMEIMDWYCKENSINFEHDNGLVSTISDLSSDTSNGWLLYINDEISQYGAADYIPAEGEKVEWKYVNYEEMFDF